MYAYFSDIETSKGNTFTAGTLDVKIDGQDDPHVFAFSAENLFPGASGVHIFAVYNDGTLKGVLTINMYPYTEDGGDNPEPEISAEGEGNNPNLDDVLYILIWQDDNPRDGIWQPGEELLYLGDILSDCFTLPQTSPVGVYRGHLEPKATLNVAFKYEVLETDDNSIMGDTVSFDLEFKLEHLEEVQ